MIPPVRGTTEAVPLGNNIKENKQAFFDANIYSELRFDVVEYPVSELNKGHLVHMAELVKSIGNSHEQIHGPFRAC